MDEVQESLRYAFQTNNRLTLPVSGTGTAAMETAVVNMVEPGDHVLVCVNGYFGARIAEMAARHGGEVRTIRRRWGEVFSPAEIQEAVAGFSPKVVAIVQAETSTGALQPLEEITSIVHAAGGVLIVDAVTSLGGVPLHVDAWDIDVCYSGTQKCLGCPPGLGPITLGPRAEEVLQQRKTPVPAFYLDLSLLGKYWGTERAYHHTAPITANYALREGLRLVAEEGLENRWRRHRRHAERLWAGLQALGLQCHVDLPHRLPTLTTVVIPSGVDDLRIRRRLLEEYAIEIAGGLGELKGQVWRVGLMGYSSSEENVDLLLDALKNLLS
jgi:alanine-glyoxylate transaminase/serine-glyoxylate transaminase/serine-pyruvate transaminase